MKLLLRIIAFLPLSATERSLRPPPGLSRDASNSYSVTIGVAGNVFDHNMEYNRQLTEHTCTIA